MPLSQPPLTAILLVAFAALALGSGCDFGTFEQDFDTELQIYDPGPHLNFVEVQKRFRFSRDPADADRVTILNGSLEVLAPPGSDFRFLDSLEVYVVRGDERLLIASTGVFDPRRSRMPLIIDYAGDLRGWTVDRRVSLTFVAYPVRTFLGWPQGGFTVRAVVTLEVEAF
jgi:hypothetical protein